MENRKEIARLTICQLLELDNYTGFQVIIPEGEFIPLQSHIRNYDEIVKKAQSLPEIKKALLEIKGADMDIRLAKSTLYPSIVLKSGYGSRYSNQRQKIQLDSNEEPVIDAGVPQYVKYTFGSQLRDNASSYIVLSLNIPIFNMGKARNQVRAYQIGKQRVEYNLGLKHKQLCFEIKQAIINAKSALEQYHILISNVEVAKEAFSHIEKKLNVGVTSYYDYMIALNNLTMANMQASLMKYEYIFCDKIIDFYTGIPIRL